jgi:hypothetical protein
MSAEVMFVGGPADGWHEVTNMRLSVIVRVETHGPFTARRDTSVDHVYTLEHCRLPPDEFTDARDVPVYIHRSLSPEQAAPIIERRLGV